METTVLGISLIEWIGYLASAVLLTSFMMKKIKMLRIVNSAGCILFIVYGFLLDVSWPIVITNMAITSINIYYLLIAPRFSNNNS